MIVSESYKFVNFNIIKHFIKSVNDFFCKQMFVRMSQCVKDEVVFNQAEDES